MSEVKTLKCDVCEKLRLNDSNHWLEGSFKNDCVVISLLGKLRWEPKLHLCGQACAMKWVGTKLGEL
jgi:hypothetical protein